MTNKCDECGKFTSEDKTFTIRWSSQGIEAHRWCKKCQEFLSEKA